MDELENNALVFGIWVVYLRERMDQGMPLMQPVASKPIPGTAWLEVRTNLGYVYYYSSKTQESVWEKPKEVEEAEKAREAKKKVLLDPAKLQALKRAKAHGAVLAPEYEEVLRQEDSGGKNRGQKAKADDSVAPAGEVEEFDVEFDQEDIVEETHDIQQQNNSGEKNEKEIEAAYETLLEEIGVNGFSLYSQKLKMMQDDARFQAVDPSQRRRLFDSYCKRIGARSTVESGETKQVEKKRRHGDFVSSKSSIDSFMALLQEKVIRSDVYWADIVHTLERDVRFREVETWEGRELFVEHRRQLEKADRARDIAHHRIKENTEEGQRRQTESSRIDAKNNFKALLAEVVRDPLASWESEKDVLQKDPQKRGAHPLLDEATCKTMFEEHVARVYASAKENLVSLFEKQGLPKTLALKEVQGCLDEEDLEEFHETLQKDAWESYISDTAE